MRQCLAQHVCCRVHPDAELDDSLEAAILELLRERDKGKTICPSEAARAVSDEWRPLMDRTRSAAQRLVARGVIDIVQKGEVVTLATARGPIRLRLRD